MRNREVREIRDLAFKICDFSKRPEVTSCDKCLCSKGCLVQYYAHKAYAALGLTCKTHYIVTYKYAITDSLGNFTEDFLIVEIAHTKEEACRLLKKYAYNDRVHAMENDWEIIEDSETCFNAGEHGNYELNHTCWSIATHVDDEKDIKL